MILHIPNPLDMLRHKPKPSSEEHAASWLPIAPAESNRLIQPEDLSELAPNADFHVLIPTHEPIDPAALHAAVEEIPMATAPVTPPAPKPNVFKSIMTHIVHFFELGLNEIIVYTPPAEALAEVLFPEYVKAEQMVRDKIVTVTKLIRNSVLSAQQKYAEAAKGDATNKAKLADALQVSEGPAVAILSQTPVVADASRVTSAIEALVAILKSSPAPAGA